MFNLHLCSQEITTQYFRPHSRVLYVGSEQMLRRQTNAWRRTARRYTILVLCLRWKIWVTFYETIWIWKIVLDVIAHIRTFVSLYNCGNLFISRLHIRLMLFSIPWHHPISKPIPYTNLIWTYYEPLNGLTCFTCISKAVYTNIFFIAVIFGVYYFSPLHSNLQQHTTSTPLDFHV